MATLQNNRNTIPPPFKGQRRLNDLPHNCIFEYGGDIYTRVVGRVPDGQKSDLGQGAIPVLCMKHGSGLDPKWIGSETVVNGHDHDFHKIEITN